MIKSRVSILFLILVAIAWRPTFSLAANYSFSDFSNLSGFNLNGATANVHGGSTLLYNGDYVLRLTGSNESLGIGGSAFYNNTFVLGDDDSFSSYFQFQITESVGVGDGDGQGGDGLMFVLQTQGSGALGTGGGYLGFGQGQTYDPPAISHSIGIEFDTFDNDYYVSGAGTEILDYNGNHVGIDMGGNLVSLTSTSVGSRMNNGSVWSAWVDYDGASDLLEVRVSESSNRPTSALLSYGLDLSSYFGTSGIYAGFTSGVGSAASNHDIKSWEFSSTAPVVPEPVSTTLFMVGGATLGIRRWRKRK